MSDQVRVFSGCESLSSCCDNKCLEIYNPGCESTGPECCPAPTQCKDDCPPLRARDAIRLKTYELERWFSLSEHCKDAPLDAVNHCIDLHLERVGACTGEGWRVKITAADSAGRIRVLWPGAFLAANPGYYRGEFFVDGCSVAVVLFYKPFQKVNVQAPEVVVREFCPSCGTGPCGCSFPEVEQPNYSHTPDCGDPCNAGCK